jgi:hypothetical protein
MPTPTFKFELTVHELVSITDVLKKARSESDYRVERGDLFSKVYPTKEDGKNDYSAEPIGRKLDTWTINQIRTDLVERARIATLIEKLTGEVLTDDTDAIEQRIAAAEAEADKED